MDRGLTGDQGVLIPEANQRHLMLRDEVVKAVESGQFFVRTFQNIDQAVEILTDCPAGVPDAGGTYPAESINGRVAARLQQLAALRMRFADELGQNGDKDLSGI